MICADPISDDVFEVEGFPEMISDEAIGVLADLFLAIAEEHATT
jgi:hypothetical protein